MEKWTYVYVTLGGNIGDTYSVLQLALTKIRTHPSIRELHISHFYRTSPVDVFSQDPFINAVCRFETSLTPKELLESLENIELELGKVPKPKNASRIIDLDILFYGDLRIDESRLTIPHPRWRERLFVLIPLTDLAKQYDPALFSALKLLIDHVSSNGNDRVERLAMKQNFQ